ncbi:Hypothetical predicted protein [Pelobates cultripes]|uniref:ZP domain-containing protein n=1 Tax=Pelobates cultripes TaxID=61616 RepID=A0AAD1TCL8_PELCU|nr:Hypothetical predicted protein [Pelobates cultripes]
MLSSPGSLNFVAVLIAIGLAAQQCVGQSLNCSSEYNRYPNNSDITVNCGPSTIELVIIACPVQYAMFNPDQLALNSKYNMSNCLATLDTTVNPPVVRYSFPLNDTTANSCGNTIQIADNPGTGIFNDYLTVQTVIISGSVSTPPSNETGLISYSTNLVYDFSCSYPLQYLLNNTELFSSSANVAVNTNNGSFISILSMQVFTDSGFTTLLQANGPALQLKKPVYVQVKATNLTTNFNVLLDHCFATPSPLVTTQTSEKYDLFVGCTVPNKTTILSNGAGSVAQFRFEAFRFVQSSNQQTSTIYLHCIIRLCSPDECAKYTTCGSSSRRKRAADTRVATAQGPTDPVTVSAGPIYTTDTVAVSPLSSSQSGSLEGAKQLEGTLSGLIVGIIIAAILGAALVFASVLLFKMYRLKASKDQKNGVDNFAFNGK